MTIPPLLDELLRAPGPPGTESAVAAIVRRECGTFAEVEHDVLGSTVARVRGSGAGRVVAFVAHVDQVGMIVTHVDDRGLARVTPLGNWDAAAAVGQRVVILGRDGAVTGVVHRDGDGSRVEWSELLVDVGARNGDEARSIVRAGDSAVMVAEPVELDGGRLTAVALDDRVGVFAALEALRRLAADPPAWDVVLVASVQEEGSPVGGAWAVAERIRPDIAITAEVTYASDEPGRDPGTWGHTWLGAGACVFRGPVTHPLVVDGLLAVAEAHEIPFVVEAGQATWSDSDDVFVAAEGVPTALVSIPLRYMHTAIEVVQLSDVDAVARLLEAYARSLTDDLDLTR